ncbi:TRAP transporter small permease [Planktotalea arctica]|uniref:TRAP transporter small permease n=1 Tax=Planktotalea arctica TaxID=1481893 RepID=UPI000A172FB4|nr:TRAP transporter small permease subunit [Planktotalea arctica]
MGALRGLLAPFQIFNDLILPIGRGIAVACIALMVLCILIQVFFRYVLNNALPWPDEAARFLMLWMTGLIAPSAYRVGGFVAIDMFERALPRTIAAGVSLFLLSVSLLVLVTAVRLGYNHSSGLAWRFTSATLWVPLDWVGGTSFKLKLAWMYASLFVGFVLLTIVNIELILRSLITLAGGGAQLKPLSDVDLAGAE